MPVPGAVNARYRLLETLRQFGEERLEQRQRALEAELAKNKESGSLVETGADGKKVLTVYATLRGPFLGARRRSISSTHLARLSGVGKLPWIEWILASGPTIRNVGMAGMLMARTRALFRSRTTVNVSPGPNDVRKYPGLHSGPRHS